MCYNGVVSTHDPSLQSEEQMEMNLHYVKAALFVGACLLTIWGLCSLAYEKIRDRRDARSAKTLSEDSKYA